MKLFHYFFLFSASILALFLYIALGGEHYKGYQDCPRGLYAFKASVQSVYDGDTITIEPKASVIPLKREKIRLLSIQAPELKTKSGRYLSDGIRSRNYLRGLLKGRDVLIATDKNRRGYYGRLLGTVYTVNHDLRICENVNQIMLNSGYAVPYRKK